MRKIGKSLKTKNIENQLGIALYKAIREFDFHRKNTKSKKNMQF
jgi:hypothetical protein